MATFRRNALPDGECAPVETYHQANRMTKPVAAEEMSSPAEISPRHYVREIPARNRGDALRV